mmetsp:Transcript_126812/g.283457  ORF Transcript_126812/g.283457 Transcript_126812/m.283457 type:complete len:254 (+) Transcript_126812:42-803(+)|eukprot:CAMPEP_0180429064 /NCGR_PEP_ID=MMETSP1036_2-20121128/7164_1 /TAXON_ID=632150 /ORGANISM="Azadinium spinosum, Strain 3D9" /LENGTH=253 /DNA_ID=CAMNT_0022434729 /DNA_START=9 /DNA_END=770 /DNA_ORIENTATION=+
MARQAPVILHANVLSPPTLAFFSSSRPHPRFRGSRCRVAAVLCSAVLMALVAHLSALMFIQASFDHSARGVGRRGAVVAAMIAATSGVTPTRAATTAPSYIDVSGMPSPYEKANGQWTKASGQVNKNAIYKRDGTDYYLLVNDCGKFQISRTTSSECKGFAVRNTKDTWLVDEKEVVGQVKFTPRTGLFVKGDKVEVSSEFKSDDDEARSLKQGLKGVILSIDDEGDAAVRFDGMKVDLFVLSDNFSKLKRTA